MKSIGTYDHRPWKRQPPQPPNTRPPQLDCSPGPWLPIRTDDIPDEPVLDFIPDDLPIHSDMLIRIFWYETGIDQVQPHDQDDIGQDFRLWSLRRYRDNRENRDDRVQRIITNYRSRMQLRYLVESRFYRTNPPLPEYHTSEEQELDQDRLRIAQAAALREYDSIAQPTAPEKKKTVYRYA